LHRLCGFFFVVFPYAQNKDDRRKKKERYDENKPAYYDGCFKIKTKTKRKERQTAL
jgi:hypothetical protein